MSIRSLPHLLLLLPVAFWLLATPVSASTTRIEFQLFKSLCTVVEIPESDLEPIDRGAIDKLAFELIQDQLRQRGLRFPVEHGRKCFPGKVGIAPHQLSIRFSVVLARGPGNDHFVILSLTAHDFFQDLPRSPFEYPTRILFCHSDADVPLCIANHVSQFFNDTTLRAILRAQELLKGEKR